MEEETQKVEANFRNSETRGNFKVENPVSNVMDINSNEFMEYKKQVEADDTAKLSKVREDITQFTERYTNPFTPYESDLANNPHEVVDGKYIVEYVPKETLGVNFGAAYGNEYAQIRNDLSPRVQSFVKAHELYHLQDDKPGGWFRRELRANLYPGLKDPIGLISTIRASLNKERLGLYFARLKNKY